MWLYRGVQSAVFYYATCTPCANSLDRRKRRKDAARSQREKAKSDALVTDQPRPFAQPTPFSTNQGWMVEISLGPGPPARKGGNRNRRVESWNTDGLSAGDSKQDLGSDDGLPPQKKDRGASLKHPLGDRWSRMRYQREDEPLWGEEVEVKGSSIGLSGRGKADVHEPSKYYIARVPPVNDLHPPIVSGPKSRAETRWMLQPPPSAIVMAGRARSDVSALPSNRSSRRMDGERVTPELERSTSNLSASEQTQQPSSTQHADRNTLKPSISLSTDFRVHKTPTPQAHPPFRFPRRPPSVHGRDESNFVVPNTLPPRSASPSSISTSDSDARSPSISWQCPVTPASRPGSKATNDSKLTRPQLSKTLSSLGRTNKSIQMLQLEINDHNQDEVGLGQLEPYRPWRWSMDI